MTTIAAGDMARMFHLRRQTTDLKAALQQHLAEVTTGRAADLVRHVGGDLTVLSAIDASLSRLTAYRAVTAEAAVFAGAAQAALTAIDASATDVAPRLLGAAGGGLATGVDILAADARQRFEAMVGALNTRAAGRSLFAGQATDRAALAPADVILQAVEVTVDDATTPAAIEMAMKAWFDDPAGFAATAYRGAGPLASLPVAEGEAAHLDVTATDAGLRDTLRGFAMAALLDRGALAGSPAARADLARRAGAVLTGAASGRAETAARLGIAEQAIEGARTRNEAEASTTEIARAGLVSVDPYAAATRLEQTRTQLEAIYTLTARLSRLNLAEYLR